MERLRGVLSAEEENLATNQFSAIADRHYVAVFFLINHPLQIALRGHDWIEDDGWKGICAELSVSARGGNFEEAKKNMEAALQIYISSLLRDRGAIIAS